MILKSIDYRVNEGEPGEWALTEFTLGPINLLVGKNASGKTRALKVISGLAILLSGELRLTCKSARFDVEFEHEGESFNYWVRYDDSKVVEERLIRGDRTLLERQEGGKGTVFAEKENRKLEFQTPENQLAAVARRDTIQHPFFEPLHDWAVSLYLYEFGSDMGKDTLAVLKEGGTELNLRNTTQVVAAFRSGRLAFGDRFIEAIVKGMGAIGYPLEQVGLVYSLGDPSQGEVAALQVKECDLNVTTGQRDMSQGMFRALSLIIQTTYSEMVGRPSCILIDDIGEGLDFERSVALIELLMEKAEKSSIQLVMATNDRFVMNKVPLETWSLLQRDGGKCRVRNYANSKAAFDEFKLTGMTNFDFFAVDFVNEEHAVSE